MCAINSQVVLLQTAKAVIKNPDKAKVSVEVRLLFDGGSQKSYLSKRARDLLKLEACSEQALSIATFGSPTGRRKVCPIVNVKLQCSKGYPDMSLCLYVVPTICEPLVSQPITTCVQSHPHLLALELADTSDTGSSLPIDLLVRSDYYWELVTGT